MALKLVERPLNKEQRKTSKSKKKKNAITRKSQSLQVTKSSRASYSLQSKERRKLDGTWA